MKQSFKKSLTKIMENKQTIIMMLFLGMFIIGGCTAKQETATTSVETTIATTIESTTTIEGNMTRSEWDLPCPEKYQRNYANGSSYCPDQKIFGCKSYESCGQVLE